ncbi:MAG: SPASM domain-containing protein [Oscillospiraceae bacterium]|nr:SPASM domain-containing protein [Oscillospiraceae bacterium]
MGTEHLSLLIKPASSLCNLKCRYCFYHDLADNRNIKSYGIMQNDVADILIENAVNAAEKSISFAFQGGEPSLAGFDYFRYFIYCVNKTIKNSSKKLQVNYSIQTNGINISEDFAKFLKDNNFLVGLSLDGVKEINDYFRIDAKNDGTYNKIIKTAELFDKLKIDYNILTVITAQTAKHIEKIYNFYKKRGFFYLQFIPCLEPLVGDDFPGVSFDKIPGASESPRPASHYLTPELYEKFLINLFNLWYSDFIKNKYISIRFFDNLVRIAAGYPPEQCGTYGFCTGQFVIESDGSVYPCDFYCVDNWKTGNILDMSFEDLYSSPNMQKFRETSLYKNYFEQEREKCEACKVYYLCRGGCRRDRDNKKDGFAGENIYCEALYNFYCFAEPHLNDIIKNIKI